MSEEKLVRQCGHQCESHASVTAILRGLRLENKFARTLHFDAKASPFYR